MKIRLHNDLPFISAKLAHNGLKIELHNMLLDTGSATTLFSVDRVADIGVKAGKEDVIERMFGVGGVEFVISKNLMQLRSMVFTLKMLRFKLER